MNWHFWEAQAAAGEPAAGGAYRLPEWLGADYVDDYCQFVRAEGPTDGFGCSASDFRFAYIGPPGSWTPLHIDVCGTFSWSYNVCGVKEWFFMSEESQRSVGLACCNGSKDIRVMSDVGYMFAEQGAGDLVFVPSGWPHQVHNRSGDEFPFLMGDERRVRLVVSINRNWTNPNGVARMATLFRNEVEQFCRFMGEDLEVSRRAFGDHWREHVDCALKSSGGWNVATMLKFIQFCQSHPMCSVEERQLLEGARRCVLEAEKLVAGPS
jgi:hypothetical protein